MSLVMIYLLAAAITVVGATIQGSVGIGLGFVSVPLLVLINPKFVPGPLLLAALVLTLLIVIREHRTIEFKGIWWAVFGRMLGTVAGVLILGFIPAENLSTLFGIVILLAVIISLSGFRLKISGKNLLVTGTLSGLMATTAAIGGVAMALVYQDFDGPRLRGTLSGIFVMGTIISIIGLASAGRFGWQEIQMSGMLIPGVISGYFISFYTSRMLDRKWIRPIVLTIASLAGIIVVLRNML